MSNDEKKSPKPSANATPAAGSSPFLLAVLGASVIALVTFLGAKAWLPDVVVVIPDVSPHDPVLVDEVPVVAPADRVVARARFFDSEVEPEIEKTDQLNREAAERCVRRLRGIVTEYRYRVEPFVEDLTSISTRFGIISRMPGGWWSEDGRVEDYVAEKFEKHLFSEKKLLADVSGVLEQFRSEVDANQKRMLVNVQACLDTADLPEVDVQEYETFYQSVAQRLSEYSAKQGSASVYNALTVLVISEAGSYAAVTLVSGVLVRFGAMAATTAAAAGGATAGASATGAGGGSLAGPVGTAVGLGVGLVIGLAIDWWMTEQFEEEMEIQLKDYLSSLERAILYGAERPDVSAGSPGETAGGEGVSEAGSGGIADALPKVCNRLEAAYRERFYEQIVTVEN
ncbi:hypothetical protein OAF47_01035 [bacterium]|nr:hypothetical protein [bacterium]